MSLVNWAIQLGRQAQDNKEPHRSWQSCLPHCQQYSDIIWKLQRHKGIKEVDRKGYLGRRSEASFHQGSVFGSIFICALILRLANRLIESSDWFLTSALGVDINHTVVEGAWIVMNRPRASARRKEGWYLSEHQQAKIHIPCWCILKGFSGIVKSLMR